MEKLSKSQLNWNKKYLLAKAYYEHYGNLSLPHNFKTKDGYTYDEDGENLFTWVNNQRKAFTGHVTINLNDDKIRLLNKIGISWFSTSRDDKLQNEIITCDNIQRKKIELLNRVEYLLDYVKDDLNKLSSEEINNLFTKLLNRDELGIKLQQNRYGYSNNKWEDMYDLAKKYYNHYHHLNIPSSFKTLNGYNYDKDGIKLSSWIDRQRQKLKNGLLEDEKINLLNELGMIWNFNDYHWNKMYLQAKEYYNEHGDLKITKKDDKLTKLRYWINTQRRIYKGKYDNGTMLSEKQIKLLNDINFEWFMENTNKKLQSELIDYNNIGRKKIEINNRVLTYIQSLDNTLTSKEKINDGFIKVLKRQ